jgi:hypothetical protein
LSEQNPNPWSLQLVTLGSATKPAVAKLVMVVQTQVPVPSLPQTGVTELAKHSHEPSLGQPSSAQQIGAPGNAVGEQANVFGVSLTSHKHPAPADEQLMPVVGSGVAWWPQPPNTESDAANKSAGNP